MKSLFQKSMQKRSCDYINRLNNPGTREQALAEQADFDR